MMRHQLFLLILLAVILPACAPVPMTGPESAMPVLPTMSPTLVSILSSGHDVADLLRDPPLPGKSVEVDAYFSGTGLPSRPGPPPVPGQMVCPNFYASALTDRPFPAELALLNGITSNGLPDNTPWLIATTSEAIQPDARSIPQFPYHARLRGHLGDPAVTQCQHADRIFVVEGVVRVYAEKPPESLAYELELPEGYATWLRYHDATLGFSLPHPPDWRIERVDDVSWNLRAPQWPNYPVVVRVHTGETHYDQYDSASMPSLMQEATGFGVFEQDMVFDNKVDSQRLAGYQVDREAGPSERSVSVLFSGGGRTYELALRYPVGFDAPQPLLTVYSAIVVGFRLDVPPGLTPTPPVKQALGAGPFLSKDEALTRFRERNGRETELLDAKLTSEAEARELADACNTFMGHPEGVWVLTIRGVFEGMTRTMRLFLDAVSGVQLCGEEIHLNATPWPTMPPGVTATPVPATARLPNSPDGRLLLLRGDVSPYELWTVRPDGTGAERLPMPGLELKDDVIPSPDGKSLLLIRSHEPGRIARRSLELYNLAIGQSAVLTSAPLTGAGVQEARWSPDGHDIAFTSDAQNGQSVFDVWLVSSDGQGLRPLTRFPVTPTARLDDKTSWFAVPHAEAAGMVFAGAHTLQWSPDRNWIAFAYVADQRASPEIKVVRASDGELRSTTVTPGSYRFNEFTWTPDGRGLLYLERLGSSQARTWRVALDGTPPVFVADHQVIGPWSPDWKRMAFNVWPSGKLVSPEIWLYDDDTGGSRRLVQAADLDAADVAKGQSGWSNSWLGTSTGSPWSPDGRWVALIAQRDNQARNTTWIAAVDDSALRKVADGEIVAWLP
jgi:hypothetical protein